MEFFNKKEEVIELVLTQKGREIYSQGKFKPVYYSFHDTDITYDDGSGEEQNNTVPRIKDTPTLKSIVGLQNPITSFADYASNKNKQKEFVLKNEIGSKTLGDQYAPSWNIKFLKTPPFQWYGTNRDQISDNKKYQLNFSSSIDFDKSSQELVPQFNIQTLYQVYDVDDLTQNMFSIKFPKQNISKESLFLYFQFAFANATDRFGLPLLKVKKINILGIEIQVYEIFLKFLNKNVDIPVAIFNSAFDDFYNSSILILTQFFNSTFLTQLQTTDELVSLLNNGFETGYIYNFEQVKELVKGIKNLDTVLEVFKTIDGTQNSIEFYDKSGKPFKFFIPGYEIFKSMWVVKDPNILIDFQELNANETNEDSMYELKYYEIINNAGLYKKLNTDQIREYISISFDSVAELENKQLTKNIYDPNGTDDTTC